MPGAGQYEQGYGKADTSPQHVFIHATTHSLKAAEFLDLNPSPNPKRDPHLWPPGLQPRGAALRYLYPVFRTRLRGYPEQVRFRVEDPDEVLQPELSGPVRVKVRVRREGQGYG